MLEGRQAGGRTRLHIRILQRALLVLHLVMRPMTLGVRAIVIDGEGQLFLVRHSYLPGWHLPGGGVEVGETALTALTRELDEEANVVLAGPPVLLGIYLNRSTSRRDHVMLYVVRDFAWKGPRKPDWEIVESDFFPLDALRGV